jgi:hypothetical protein
MEEYLVMQPNALSLEYQREYGCARRDLDVSDLVNNAVANGKCSVLGLGFPEQTFDTAENQTYSSYCNPVYCLHDGLLVDF